MERKEKGVVDGLHPNITLSMRLGFNDESYYGKFYSIDGIRVR